MYDDTGALSNRQTEIEASGGRKFKYNFQCFLLFQRNKKPPATLFYKMGGE